MSRLTNDEIRNRAISIIRNLTAEENGLTHGDLGILSSFLLIERTDKDKLTHYKDLEEQGRLIVRKHERCEYCSDGETLKGQRIMASNYGWQDINYCPNCGAKMEGSKW